MRLPKDAPARRRLAQVAVALAALAVASLIWPRDETPPPASEAARPLDGERPARTAEGESFDYYVLVLSWSPTHCASDQGRGRDDDRQCRSGRPYGFVLHGLWPQHERGYPQDCPSGEPRLVSDAVLDRVLEISPSEQLVQHEWRKHGACSGLNQAKYFATAEAAFRAVTVPPPYRSPAAVVTTTADDVRAAFLEANPNLSSDGVAATCRRNDIAEVWLCLDTKLAPRACGQDVSGRHCGSRPVRMRSVRGNWPR